MAESGFLMDQDTGSSLPFDPVMMQKNRGDMADFSKWQLDNEELVENIFYVLTGYHKEINKAGNQVWARDDDEQPTLSDAGAREVQSVIYPVTQKNILLSNMEKEKIGEFTEQIVRNVIIRIGSDPERFGLNDENGMPDVSKIYKVTDIVETTVYAALTRSNDYKTLDELNRGHQIHEMVKQQPKPRGFSFFRQQQPQGGQEYE